jgi:hypothetical protein
MAPSAGRDDGWALMVNALTLARHRAAEDLPSAA